MSAQVLDETFRSGQRATRVRRRLAHSWRTDRHENARLHSRRRRCFSNCENFASRVASEPPCAYIHCTSRSHQLCTFLPPYPSMSTSSAGGGARIILCVTLNATASHTRHDIVFEPRRLLSQCTSRSAVAVLATSFLAGGHVPLSESLQLTMRR